MSKSNIKPRAKSIKIHSDDKKHVNFSETQEFIVKEKKLHEIEENKEDSNQSMSKSKSIADIMAYKTSMKKK